LKTLFKGLQANTLACLATLTLTGGPKLQATEPSLFVTARSLNKLPICHPSSSTGNLASTTDGNTFGRADFVTGVDSAPYWQIDLKETFELDKIIICKNSRVETEPPAHLVVTLSLDGEHWVQAQGDSELVWYRYQRPGPGTLSPDMLQGHFTPRQIYRYVRLTFYYPTKGSARISQVAIIANPILGNPADERNITDFICTTAWGKHDTTTYNEAKVYSLLPHEESQKLIINCTNPKIRPYVDLYKQMKSNIPYDIGAKGVPLTGSY
jgi:hypothetical protein